MRHVICKDKLIENIKPWKKEDIAFWKEHLGITPTYEVIDMDFSDYPTYVDEDGDIRPTAEYLKSLNDMVVKKFGEFGMDFIIMLVHEDNWRSHGPLWEKIKEKNMIKKDKGIWGTNMSYVYGKQCLDYCRWDKDNPANTFGTAYHERKHSFDAIIKVELGIDINPIVEAHLRAKYSDDLRVISYLNKNGFRWDRDVVHGGMNPPFAYIRWKENEDILPVIKPYLLQAFEKRKERHEEEMIGMQRTIIKLATQVLYLLRAKMNRKNGVPRN